MRRIMLKYHVTALCAVLAILIQIVGTSGVAGSPSPTPVFADTDLRAEGRTLDAFVDVLVGYDRKIGECSKKASITQAEFDSQQRLADDLKGRLSAVQNALRQIIVKLKAAGQFDNLDQMLLARINDPKFQELVRRDGFKKTLEEAASGLTNDANQISSPLDALRSKLKAQTQDVITDPYRPILAYRAVRVAYATPLAMTGVKPFRCRLAWLRTGFDAAFGRSAGEITTRTNNTLGCYCEGNQTQCDAL